MATQPQRSVPNYGRVTHNRRRRDSLNSVHGISFVHDETAQFGPQMICIDIRILRADVPPQIEIQRRLIQVGLYGNRVTGV